MNPIYNTCNVMTERKKMGSSVNTNTRLGGAIRAAFSGNAGGASKTNNNKPLFSSGGGGVV